MDWGIYSIHGVKFTKEQFEKFNSLLPRFPNILIKHAANSAATLFHKETHLDMVRVGLMIYGIYPQGNANRPINLKPALSFKSRVVYIKRVPAQTPISYGGIYTTRKETSIATLPVGYADGYSRRLSNRAKVLINGKRYPVVGRVTMDMILVDAGDDRVSVGDEAVLIGSQGIETITADEIAALDDTISYEVICNIGKRVPRIYK